MKQLIKILLFLLYISIPSLLSAQKEVNVWVYGTDVGIDFNYSRFTPFQGTGMNQAGASASICDKKSGQLLFYTNGRNVWNRNFKKMPNGLGLRGGYSTTQAVLIVPNPKNENLFYIFTTKSFSDSTMVHLDDSKLTGSYYSLVDVRMNNGLGDVVEKNTLVLDKATEKLTAVPHINGKDFWLITHEWGTDKFVVFPITDKGIGVAQKFGFGMTYGHWESQGWLLPSPDGTMLACAISSPPDYENANPLELYDFNASTGEISNRRELGKYPNLKGVSFSPNNTKLYFSTFDNYNPHGSQMFQLDLNQKNIDDILKTKYEIKFIYPTGIGMYDTLAGGAFQLAPDGRIYTELTRGNEYKEKLFYIDKPNLSGPLCSPSERDFSLISRSNIGISVPNLMPYYFNYLEPKDNFNSEQECLEGLVFRMFPNPTNDQLKISINNPACLYPLKITIYNCLGQMIEIFDIQELEIPIIDLENLPSATYLLKFELPFHVFVKKVVKI